LADHLGIKLLNYESAVRAAFDRIEQQDVLSSWTDALSNDLDLDLKNLMKTPKFGCLKDLRTIKVSSSESTIDRVMSIGGTNGWYYGNWLWSIRGYLDKLLGGVGLRRGRKNQDKISAGETLDFWRVIYSSKEDKRLLLYAEMKLPGEAWLEFKVNGDTLTQTAIFRPIGLLGRLYWYSLIPIHHFIFGGMAKRLAA